MAIEYRMVGIFPLDDTLSRRLRAVLGADARERSASDPAVKFELTSALLLVRAIRRAAFKNRSTLYFRVLDLNQAVEATNMMLACVAAALEQLPPHVDVELRTDETLLMERKWNRTKVIEPVRKGIPFWDDDRRRILGVAK